MPLIRRSSKYPIGMGTFKRGLTISPFQIPILAYLFFAGLMSFFAIHDLAVEVQTPDWVAWQFCIVLTMGAGLATFSRFNDNERLETFGLLLLLLAVVEAMGISLAAGQYLIGDEIAIGTGCALRIWVLLRSRKAERVAIEISGEQMAKNHEGEKP